MVMPRTDIDTENNCAVRAGDAFGRRRESRLQWRARLRPNARILARTPSARTADFDGPKSPGTYIFVYFNIFLYIFRALTAPKPPWAASYAPERSSPRFRLHRTTEIQDPKIDKSYSTEDNS